MRKIKFRYLLKDQSKKIHEVILTVSDIELGTLNKFLVRERMKIIARDISTGTNDMEGNELFENDIIETETMNYFKRSKIIFDDGSFIVERNGFKGFHIGSSNYKSKKLGNIHQNPGLMK